MSMRQNSISGSVSISNGIHLPKKDINFEGSDVCNINFIMQCR